VVKNISTSTLTFNRCIKTLGGKLYQNFPREKLLIVRTITAFLIPLVKSFAFTKFRCGNPQIMFSCIPSPPNQKLPATSSATQTRVKYMVDSEFF